MKRKMLLWLTMITLTFGLFGCGAKEEAIKEEHPETEVAEDAAWTFTDSAGREVELPAEIKTLAPTGPMAQVVLYTAAPERLAGVAVDFTEEAGKYLDSKYLELPKFGQFYGKNASLNMEALLAANPDVIIDIGEAKETIKEDMDSLQKQLGIPVVFIEATMETMDQTYEKLGELLGNESEMEKLSAYCRETMDHAQEMSSQLSVKEQVSIYLALGEQGLNTSAAGSFHTESFDILGIKNVAAVEVTGQGGGSQVSLEQVINWNPQVILTYTEEIREMIATSPEWSGLDAVKNGRIYKIPTAPYNFVADPPSVNRMIGIDWLGALIYPEQYSFDDEKLKEFYELFYHLSLTDAELDDILGETR